MSGGQPLPSLPIGWGRMPAHIRHHGLQRYDRQRRQMDGKWNSLLTVSDCSPRRLVQWTGLVYLPGEEASTTVRLEVVVELHAPVWVAV